MTSPQMHAVELNSDDKPRLVTGGRMALAGFALLALVALALLWSSGEPAQDGKPVTYWIRNLGTSGSGSEDALDKLGPKRTIPYLLGALRGEEQPGSAWQRFYVRHYAEIPSALRQRLPKPKPPEPRDRIEFAQSRAAYYLVHLADKHPSEARVVVPHLVPLLEHSNRVTRFSAGIALSGFGTNAAPAIPTIENLMNNNPAKIHDIMLVVLEQCGAHTLRTIPTLKKCAANSGGDLSIQCARTLWRLDPSQADFVRTIATRLAKSKDAGVRIESASLLWRIDKDPGPVVPILIGLLNEDDHPYDYRTILLLKQIGPGARDAIPALTERLTRTERKEAFFLKAADEALQSMRGAAPKSDPLHP